MPLLLHEDHCPFCKKWYDPVIEYNIVATPEARVVMLNVHHGWDSRIDYIKNALRKQTGSDNLPLPILYFEANGQAGIIVGITTKSYAEGALGRLREFYIGG